MSDQPRHGDTDSFACDGCGHGIETTYNATLGLWVGDFIITTDETIKHPGCVSPDDGLNPANADLFNAYLKKVVGG